MNILCYIFGHDAVAIMPSPGNTREVLLEKADWLRCRRCNLQWDAFAHFKSKKV